MKKMKIEYIPAIVMLLAGLASSIITIINKYEILESMITILVSMIIFYILGLIIRSVAKKILKVKKDNDDIEDKEKDSISDSNDDVLDENSLKNQDEMENKEISENQNVSENQDISTNKDISTDQDIV